MNFNFRLKKISSFLVFLTLSFCVFSQEQAVTVNAVHEDCPGQNNGMITVTLNNPEAVIYQVEIFLNDISVAIGSINGSSGLDDFYEFVDLGPGNYQIIITNPDGCTANGYIEVESGEDDLPYIEELIIEATDANGITEEIYNAGWKMLDGGNCIFFTGGSLPFDSESVLNSTSLKITVIASEKLSTEPPLTLILPYLNPNQNIMNSNDDGFTWTTDLLGSMFQPSIQDGNLSQQFIFFGTDLNGNDLLDLREYSQGMTTCVEVPSLQEDCVSYLPSIDGLNFSDDVHVLEYYCSTVEVDVDYPGNTVTLTLGANPNAVVWTGESIDQSNLDNMVLDVSNFAPGEYCVKIDFGGCIVEECVQIYKEIDVVLADMIGACPGESNGSICLDVIGGSGIFQVVWSGLGSGISGICLDGLPSNITLTYKLTDIITGQVIIESVTLPAYSSPIIQLESETATCPGLNEGSLCVSVSGGNPPYTYEWTEEGTNYNFPNAGDCIYYLTEGPVYELTVTDDCGISVMEQFKIPDYSYPSISSSLITPTCENSSSGIISITPTGGVGPYTFFWEDDRGEYLDATTEATELAEGQYGLIIVDACGTQSPAYGFSVHSTPNPYPYYISSETQHVCSDFDQSGSINLTPILLPPNEDFTGSIYNYLWNTGETTASINNLGIGIYRVTVSDNFGCEKIWAYQIHNRAISDLVPLIMKSCPNEANGAISLDYNIITHSSQLNYEYLWDTGSTEPNVDGLSPGTYFVTITRDPCEEVFAFEVEEHLPFEVNEWIYGSTWNGTVEASDGIIAVASPSGSSFNWSNGENTNVISNLESGDYSVTITNAYGCTQTYDYFVPLCGFAPNVSIGNIIPCSSSDPNGGSIEASVTGGNPPYQYVWSHLGNDIITNEPSLYHIMEEGSYTLTVIDACNRQTSVTHWFVCDCGELVLNVDISNPCNGWLPQTITVDDQYNFGANHWSGTTYEIELTSPSGTSFSPTTTVTISGSTIEDIDGGGDLSWNTSLFFNSEQGDYTFVITGDNGCVYTQVVEVNTVEDVDCIQRLTGHGIMADFLGVESQVIIDAYGYIYMAVAKK